MTNRSLWIVAALTIFVALAIAVVALSRDDGSVVAEPSPAPTASPLSTASALPTPVPPTPTSAPAPTAEPAPSPTRVPQAPAGKPDGVIWPTDASQPFGEWHEEPGVAAQAFVVALTGYQLPIGEVSISATGFEAEVVLQSIGEDGQPFGEAIRVTLAAGLDTTTGQTKWGVRSGTSDRIVVDSWTFLGRPTAFLPYGQGWAFEGTIDAKVIDETSSELAAGFVMGGGLELQTLSGSIPMPRVAAGTGYVVLADIGGLGITPTAMTVVPISWPDLNVIAPLETCSATGLDAPMPRPDLPAPVEATRQAIAAAAIACDIEALVELTSAGGFKYSFGGDGLPGQHWLAAEEGGYGALGPLVKVIDLSVAVDEGELDFYLWPSAHAKDWLDVTPEERSELLEIYTEEDLAGFDEFGGYLGYRLGILEDGEWTFFVAGD